MFYRSFTLYTHNELQYQLCLFVLNLCEARAHARRQKLLRKPRARGVKYCKTPSTTHPFQFFTSNCYRYQHSPAIIV